MINNDIDYKDFEIWLNVIVILDEVFQVSGVPRFSRIKAMSQVRKIGV